MIILNEKKIAENIEKRIGDDVSSGRVGGASVLVKQSGKVIYRACFGNAEEGKAITEDSIFRLASMTKPITAVAVMKQVDRGLVSLDDTLDKFLPEYSDMEIGKVVDGKIVIDRPAQNKIKILHLLTHSSGIGCGEVGNLLTLSCVKDEGVDLEKVVNEHAKKPISFEPYTAQAYSATAGFDILARVVEITSGMPFDSFLKKEIFEPLGMCDTTFTPLESQWDRTVRMHRFENGEAFYEPQDRHHIFGRFPLTYFCGGAGLVSTVSDYEKFADMLLAEGKTRDHRTILSEETVRLMRTPAVPESIMPKPQRWGLSMRVITEPRYRRLPVGSFGWSGAYGAHFWVDPENEVIGIYMKNSRYDGGSEALTAANFEKDVYL